MQSSDWSIVSDAGCSPLIGHLGHQHEPVVHVLEVGHVGVVDPVLEPVEQVVNTRGPGVYGGAEAEHQGEADYPPPAALRSGLENGPEAGQSQL